MSGQPIELSHDPETDVVTIDGYRFTRELFAHITASPCGITFRITARGDGVITFTSDRDPLAVAAPDMLAALHIAKLHANLIKLAPERRHVIKTLDAAIAKAEGRT